MAEGDRARRYREIGGILGSLASAAKEHGVDTALAKSGIPIVQGLAAFNEWWVGRRARKRIPREVGDELGSIYGIPTTDTDDRATIEDRLARAGVEDPDQAYELVLRRLTARIHQRDLVDYLGAASDEASGLLRQLICAVGNKYYLRRIEDVLAIHPIADREREPQWFRKCGPIAVDFAAARVCWRQDDVARLRAALDAGQVAVLEGAAATGKSVLVRQLASELHAIAAYPEVYHLDCREHGVLDQPRLFDEISDVEGLVIIEDCHLAPYAVSSLYVRLEGHPQLKALLVTRPSLWGSVDPRQAGLGDLEEDAVRLEPFAVVDEIIDLYAKGHPGEHVSWPASARDSLKAVSKGSFWLLAYALQGYVASRGDGNPLDWVGEGVREDLERLEGLRAADGDPHYPEVLVALSPLYRSEVVTAEAFLTRRMGFTVEVLNGLASRGEITRGEIDGEVHYGLPHSSLANAYWQHGSTYRHRMDLPCYEGFLAEYAASGHARNGLLAVVTAEARVRWAILSRLEDAGNLPELILQEPSDRAVLQLCLEAPLATWRNPSLVEPLADRLLRLDNACAVGQILHGLHQKDVGFAESLWRTLDVSCLANRIIEAADVQSMGKCLWQIGDADRRAFCELWQAIPTEKLAARMITADDLLAVCSCMRRIREADLRAGADLCQAFDLETLAQRCCGDDSTGGARLIRYIREGDEAVAHELWGKLDVRAWANKLVSQAALVDVLNVFGELCSAWAEAAAELSALMDSKALAGRLSACDPVRWVGPFLRYLFQASPSQGEEVCRLIDVQLLAARLNGEAEISAVASCLRNILQTHRQTGRSLWGHFDRHQYARRLEEAGALNTVGWCVQAIFEADRDVGSELLAALSLEALARRLNQAPDLEPSASCIDYLRRISPEAGATVCGLLDVRGLAKRFSDARSLRDVGRFIAEVYRSNPDVAAQLCRSLDYHSVAAAALAEEDPRGLGRALRAVWEADAASGQNLWSVLDPPALAENLLSAEDLIAVVDCIAEIARGSTHAANDLWGHLDVRRLAARVCRQSR
ncbi:MAG: hypothetical protein KAX19_10900, partial [Candidatus Brocadiae bacterium]|nr:hypothetical protein [Candidatus Brocadiia bacterium]